MGDESDMKVNASPRSSKTNYAKFLEQGRTKPSRSSRLLSNQTTDHRPPVVHSYLIYVNPPNQIFMTCWMSAALTPAVLMMIHRKMINITKKVMQPKVTTTATPP